MFFEYFLEGGQYYQNGGSVLPEYPRVNRVDPLGITNLRIRGMWQIQNPRRVFNYLHSTGKTFELIAIIPTSKYNLFSTASKNKIKNLRSTQLNISDVKVKDPNNPANLINAKLIIFQL